MGQVNGAGEISDCYNRGTVTASGSKVGGIAGYLYASSSYYANEILNCYTTEAVSGVSSAAVAGNVYSTYNSKVKNCYYLSGLTADTNATAKTADALKVLAPTLGDAFVTAPAGVNDGYPILR